MSVTRGDTASQATATPTSTPTTGGPAARAGGPAHRLRTHVPVGLRRQAPRPGVLHGYDETGKLDRFGDAAWINGASPTEGFLKFGADGPFQGFYNSIAGAALVDWLFMLGLLGIGLALTLGIATRLACRRAPSSI